MRGHLFSTGGLTDADLLELADLLAIDLTDALGDRIIQLSRLDIRELIVGKIDDLMVDDQQAVIWLVWHLFQEAQRILGGCVVVLRWSNVWWQQLVGQVRGALLTATGH